MSQREMHDRPDLYDLLEMDASATFVEIRAAADRVKRRNAEADLLSQPPSGATTEPLR